MKAETKAPAKPDHKNIFEAYAALQAELKPAIKSAENPFFKSKYADLHEISKTVKEPLANNGLIVVQHTETKDATITLITELIHVSSGEKFVSHYGILLPIPLISQIITNKYGEQKYISNIPTDPQAMGSALTYARRYQLACICGVVTEDDDAEGAMPRKAEPKPEAKPKAVKSDAAVKKQIAKDLANCKNIQEVELYLESVPEELKTENFMKYVSQIKEAFNASV